MGRFGIGLYAPISVAPAGSILNQTILQAAAGGIAGVNTLLYTTAVKSARPKAFLMLSDLSGTQIVDSSGNAVTGSVTGSVSYSVPGALSGPGETVLGGMNLLGAASIALPSFFSPAGWSGLTIEAFIEPATGQTGIPRILANSHTDIDNKGIQLYFDPVTGRVTFNLGQGSSQVAVTTLSGAAVGVYTYIACTWDGTTMKIFYNGQPQTQGVFTGPITATSYPLTIGKNPAYNGDYYTGGITMLSFYDRALPDATIAQRYQYATAIGATQVGSGFATQPFQLQTPYAGIYGGQYGYIIYTNIRAPKATQWIPAQSIGNDNLGQPVIRGFPQMVWSYSTLRPDYWYFLQYLYRLANTAPPEYQGLVLIQYPDLSGTGALVQQLARWTPPIHAYRSVGAFSGVQLKFTYIGQAQLVAAVPLVTVV